MRSLLLLATLLTLLAAPVPAVQEHAAEAVVPAALGATRNVHRSGDLWFSGQFGPDDIRHLTEAGIRRVITLRTEGEVDWDEEGRLEAAGLTFTSLPFRAADTLTDDVFDRLRRLLAADSGPTLVHCGSANRVAGAWIPYRVLDQGVPLERALAEADEIGLSHDPYRQRAIAYVHARTGGDEPSVKEGINDPYLDPDFDVEEWVARFEVESREIYARRFELLEALALEPGTRVADVGSGTGLFTVLFSGEVGAEGWVYAVDLAPGFLEHVARVAADRKLANVTPVLCSERSVTLPPDSVDVAFVCDTYHHFEYPRSTLSSIRRALVPGGRLVVVDFERIPGVTRDWLMDHVRAGKAVVRGEIESEGFSFVREIEGLGLEENYVLEFVKPSNRTDPGPSRPR